MATQNDFMDPRQLAQLRRHRRFASACLIVAGLLYLATHFVEAPGYWMLMLRSGAEAGLIGGIADWFAVTALFRRPLGLPIPHTAILPRNKDRIGAGFSAFVERHFLAPELITERLRAAHPARRIGVWLSRRHNAELVADRVTAVAPDLIGAFAETETQAFFRDAISEHLRRSDPGPALAGLLQRAVATGQHKPVVDRAISGAREWLTEHSDWIYDKVTARSSWWIPRRVDRRVARAIVNGVDEWLAELQDPEQASRIALETWIEESVASLEHSETFRERVTAIKNALLADDDLQRLLGSLGNRLQDMLMDHLEHPERALAPSLAHGLHNLGVTLRRDAAARERLDRRLDLLVQEVVLPFRARIGEFIRDVIRGWDAPSLGRRLELAVGRDLQFIRVNGTLVGALVGVVLFVVTQWIF